MVRYLLQVELPRLAFHIERFSGVVLLLVTSDDVFRMQLLPQAGALVEKTTKAKQVKGKWLPKMGKNRYSIISGCGSIPALQKEVGESPTRTSDL